MAHRFAKVSEEEIEEAFFYPSDLVNTKTTIPLRVSEEQWIDSSTLCVSVYIIPLFTFPLGDSCIVYHSSMPCTFTSSEFSFTGVSKNLLHNLRRISAFSD